LVLSEPQRISSSLLLSFSNLPDPIYSPKPELIIWLLPRVGRFQFPTKIPSTFPCKEPFLGHSNSFGSPIGFLGRAGSFYQFGPKFPFGFNAICGSPLKKPGSFQNGPLKRGLTLLGRVWFTNFRGKGFTWEISGDWNWIFNHFFIGGFVSQRKKGPVI